MSCVQPFHSSTSLKMQPRRSLMFYIGYGKNSVLCIHVIGWRLHNILAHFLLGKTAIFCLRNRNTSKLKRNMSKNWRTFNEWWSGKLLAVLAFGSILAAPAGLTYMYSHEWPPYRNHRSLDRVKLIEPSLTVLTICGRLGQAAATAFSISAKT